MRLNDMGGGLFSVNAYGDKFEFFKGRPIESTHDASGYAGFSTADNNGVRSPSK